MFTSVTIFQFRLLSIKSIKSVILITICILKSLNNYEAFAQTIKQFSVDFSQFKFFYIIDVKILHFIVIIKILSHIFHNENMWDKILSYTLQSHVVSKSVLAIIF